MNTSDIRHCFTAQKRVDKGNFSFGCFLQFEGSVEILKKTKQV
ncbi:hypothetical protein HMPREF9509_01926 [Enterococcus faecalis TX0411]|nr:hypothetical protein HMPREF9509_01926 [Enterococcus faecalis TX0411]